MRALNLAMVAVAMSCAIGAAGTSEVMAQASTMGPTAQSPIKTNKKDLGDLFTNWAKSDSSGNSMSSSSPSSEKSEGGGLSGFLSSLMPSGGDRPAAGTGPVRTTVEGTARANDANVLEITKADGSVVSVRQWGIEAPATSSFPWGPRARGELDRVLTANGGKVKCTSDGSTTRAGALVARCYAGDVDISGKLIEGGYGVEWREVSGGVYTQLESAAQAAKRGVWEAR